MSNRLDILYTCNQTRCEHCTWPLCQHTTDIKYAANFVNEDGYWKETIDDGIKEVGGELS
jgi:hypothetical protein